MSHEHAQELIKKMNNDNSFREEIFGIKGLNERMHYIVQKGFQVTKEEIELAFEDYKSEDPEIRVKEDLYEKFDDVLQMLEYFMKPS